MAEQRYCGKSRYVKSRYAKKRRGFKKKKTTDTISDEPVIPISTDIIVVQNE